MNRTQTPHTARKITSERVRVSEFPHKNISDILPEISCQ